MREQSRYTPIRGYDLLDMKMKKVRCCNHLCYILNPLAEKPFREIASRSRSTFMPLLLEETFHMGCFIYVCTSAVIIPLYYSYS
jgi:hypothetical protein